ncbi:hypothetical protein JP74_18775 [Devosia sp. 17-2-E-8]|nr:hypothetical protein JP74_18775 [Devosia sp. 17-2-E-8]
MEEPIGLDERESIFRQSVRTYGGTLHLIRWFAGHLLVLLVGLYFILVGGHPFIGGLVVAASVLVLGYGIISVPWAADTAELHLQDDGKMGLDHVAG